MDIISIKVHPPWYARGTPITNTRDGPPFDLSAYVVPDNVKMEAIREGPSARGNPVEVRSRQSAVGSQNHDSYRMEDQSRGNPGRKTRLWLTLKTTFCHTQNGVYGQWYAQLGRNDVVVDAVKSEDVDRSGEVDLSACAASDNVKLKWVYKTDADRSEDAVRSGEAAVDFDLSAYAVPDNVKMEDEERSADVVDADRSIDAVRSEERSADDFDLSAYAVPDNVKMEYNVKMEDEERFADDVDADRACPDLSGSEDAVRSEERSAVDFVDADRSIDAVRSEERSADEFEEVAAVDFDLLILTCQRATLLTTSKWNTTSK